MIILAIDCANFSTSLALVQHNKILASFESTLHHHESATLISRIQDLFKASKRSLADLDAIIVTTGPGSFTGIRLGIAAARGLAFALKVPLYAVNSFNWVANCYRDKFGLSTNLLVVLESKREELFVAFYSKDLTCHQDPRFLNPQEITNLFTIKGCQIVGDAACYFNDVTAQTTCWMPKASDLAFYMITHQLSADKFEICRPYYIRSPEIHGSA